MAQVQTELQTLEMNDKKGVIVRFIGQLDETNVDLEAKKIYEAIDGMAEPNLVLDLEGLTYMNSKSIGYVTDWYSRTAAKNGRIAIARPRPNILDILKVVGITQILPIFPTLDEAKNALANPSPDA